jgi:hypothetical protein
MLNPNAPKVVSDYERVENTLAELTSDPRHFEGSNYPSDDVRKDLKLFDDFKHTPEYKKGEERSDAKLLEKTFADMVERGDWFGEEESYGDDPDYLALVTFPTSEIDDTFNHIDVIGMISNETTGHETLPFAVDLTYNTDNDKMSQKFRWKHVYGKKESAPEEVSEFGESYIDKDYSGNNVVRTKALPLKFRYGLKIPGFASAKYYEDKNNPWDPMYEKGRIDVMPRFIVGYSTDIADVLSGGMPTDEYRKKYGEAAYQKKRSEYKNAEKRAKWCTLLECSEQASDIRYMLENMDPEETKWMQKEELEKAKKQIIAMDSYFNKALQLATDQAQTNPDEMTAMKYADRDIVRQAIKYHSDDTYIGKGWK